MSLTRLEKERRLKALEKAKAKSEAFDDMLEALKDFIAAKTMECCCGETPCCGSCTITLAKNAVQKAEAIK